MEKVLEGKERWSAGAWVLSREELEMEHEHYKGDSPPHMERLP